MLFAVWGDVMMDIEGNGEAHSAQPKWGKTTTNVLVFSQKYP